jgi:hypothetical protein
VTSLSRVKNHLRAAGLVIVSWLPLSAAIALTGYLFLRWHAAPAFINYDGLPDGNLVETQKQTIAIVTELNSFLVSLASALFAGIGFYITKYRNKLSSINSVIALSWATGLLCLTYYWAFRTYAQLTSELAQKALAITPGQSWILYYVDLEFWTFLGASVTLFTLALSAFAHGTPEPTSDEED